LWHHKIPGFLGGTVYRAIIDEAKELLKTWFQRELKEEEKSLSEISPDRRKVKTANFGVTEFQSPISKGSVAKMFMAPQSRKERTESRPNLFHPSSAKSERIDRSIMLSIPNTITTGKFILTNHNQTSKCNSISEFTYFTFGILFCQHFVYWLYL
jgi:hypothetical protein